MMSRLPTREGRRSSRRSAKSSSRCCSRSLRCLVRVRLASELKSVLRKTLASFSLLASSIFYRTMLMTSLRLSALPWAYRSAKRHAGGNTTDSLRHWLFFSKRLSVLLSQFYSKTKIKPLSGRCLTEFRLRISKPSGALVFGITPPVTIFEILSLSFIIRPTAQVREPNGNSNSHDQAFYAPAASRAGGTATLAQDDG